MPPTSVRIGALARKTGLSPDSLRHYERKALLSAPARSPGGVRLYPIEAERRVRVIQAALALGFTLDELSTVFAERRRGGAPCQRVRALAGAKLEALDAQLRSLERLRSALTRVLQDWDKRLVGAGNASVGLLDGLADAVPLTVRVYVTPRRKATQ